MRFILSEMGYAQKTMFLNKTNISILFFLQKIKSATSKLEKYLQELGAGLIWHEI
nr:MAG TPA: hypothetical protein [Caudoviricetes sp.]